MIKTALLFFFVSNSAHASAVSYKALIQTMTEDHKPVHSEKLLTSNSEIEYALRFAQGKEAVKSGERITKLYRCLESDCELIRGTYIGRAPF